MCITRFNSFIYGKAFLVMLTILCIGAFLGCSAEVNGPQVHWPDGWHINENVDYLAEKTFEFDQSIDGINKIRIEAVNGEIIVTGRDGLDRVMITARQYVGSDTLADAELHLDDLQTQVEQNDAEMIIRTIQPDGFNRRKYLVTYEVTVPADIEITTSQINGRIAISSIVNNVQVTSVNGFVLLSDIIGGAKVDVVNGNIEGRLSLPMEQTINLFIENGSILLRIPTSTSAILDAVTDIGSITTTNIPLEETERNEHLLTGKLGEGNGFIDLWSVTGNIGVIGFE